MRALGLAVLAGVGCTPAPEVSWHADVDPILQQHCTRCHTAGGLGVGDYTDLEQVRAFSEVMVSRMDAGEMPPPAADPECRDYHGSELMHLPEDKVAVFRRWMELGMPEGDPDDAVELELPPNDLDDVADLEVMMPEPYEPAFADPENPGNEYRCFVLEHGQPDDFFVTGFHPIIGESALVHHVVLFVVDREDIPESYDSGVGVDCMEGRAGELGDLEGMIAGWAPGQAPTVLDGGRGIKVGADQVLVAQMHYYQSGPEVDGLADQSGYQLVTAPSVDIPLRMAPLPVYGFEIPAGDADYTATDSYELPMGLTGRVHAVFPHMHVLGKAYRVWLEHEDGSETCVAQGQYDFENQLSYVFKEPVSIGSGDRIHLSCTWDNSTGNPDRILDEPVDTRYGERTDEEMCYMFSLVSVGQ